MDDGGKQVSWLMAEVLASPSRRSQLLGRRQWFFDARRTTYSCGGSPGFTPEFPLNPLGGELVARREDASPPVLRQVSGEFLRRAPNR